MGERLNFKQTADLTPRQIVEGVMAYEATAEGVTYRIEGSVIDPQTSGRRHFRAYRVVDDGRLHPAGHGGPQRTCTSAIQQCEADLDDVLRDRNGRPVPERDRQITADPATTDDTQELLDRVIRRAQYLALQAVLAEVDKRLAFPIGSGPWNRGDIRQMVNDAARALGTAEPYRVAP
jgi:hypothetical protein